ncbi:MAG: ABC transporter permease subunit [Chloroflexi bacterium]|nr:ABC transporter permease subunit [Chloroflexota bacterium]
MSVDVRERPAETAIGGAVGAPQAERERPRLPTVDILVILGLIGGVYALARIAALWSAPLATHVEIDLSPAAIPGYALASVIRMAAAYVLSMVFSLIYGRAAASGAWAERLLMPVLDILQSIPILSFMPGVVLALVALFPNNNVGLELAAIVLIFTSQAWNLAFSFYQSLRTIPSDLREAATINRLSSWQRFTKLELPFGTIGLVWNSMMSWAGGWFFLMAAEQFTLGDKDFRLRGLGSYLKAAADSGDIGALVLGLFTLIAIIVLLDQLLWRPLVAWSEKFRFEQTESAEVATSRVLTALRRSALLEWLNETALPRVADELHRLGRRPPPRRTPAATRGIPLVGRTLLLVVFGAAALWGVYAIFRLLMTMTVEDWQALPPAALATLLRTAFALLIGTAWTVPVGVAIGLNPRLARRAQPLVQMAASIPATALFPVLLLLLIGLPGGLNVAAVALMLLGTQWYLLFNVIAGAQAIPSDLREAALIYRLSGWRRWRYLILPAVFPFLLTGLITATGGAWNASIVSEYVTFGGDTYQTIGLGALIADAANNAEFARLASGTLVMAGVVVSVNRLLWRRLYRAAEQRYRLE